MLNYLILVCFASCEPFRLDSVALFVFFQPLGFPSSETFPLDALGIPIFLPGCFDFNVDVNSIYSADKSTNYIVT